MFKRRIVLGGITPATIIASGVLAAGTALAAATPQLPAAVPVSASPLIPGGPMAQQLPGLLGAIQAIPSVGNTAATGTSANGAASQLHNVTTQPGISGLSGAAQNAGTGSSGLNGVTGGASPATANLPVLGSAAGTAGSATGGLGNVSSQVPALGILNGGAPGLSQATGALGGL